MDDLIHRLRRADAVRVVGEFQGDSAVLIVSRKKSSLRPFQSVITDADGIYYDLGLDFS